jgi:hypothetical protein
MRAEFGGDFCQGQARAPVGRLTPPQSATGLSRVRAWHFGSLPILSRSVALLPPSCGSLLMARETLRHPEIEPSSTAWSITLRRRSAFHFGLMHPKYLFLPHFRCTSCPAPTGNRMSNALGAFNRTSTLGRRLISTLRPHLFPPLAANPTHSSQPPFLPPVPTASLLSPRCPNPLGVFPLRVPTLAPITTNTMYRSSTSAQRVQQSHGSHRQDNSHAALACMSDLPNPLFSLLPLEIGFFHPSLFLSATLIPKLSRLFPFSPSLFSLALPLSPFHDMPKIAILDHSGKQTQRLITLTLRQLERF